MIGIVTLVIIGHWTNFNASSRSVMYTITNYDSHVEVSDVFMQIIFSEMLSKLEI